jgi:hypothetical protein
MVPVSLIPTGDHLLDMAGGLQVSRHLPLQGRPHSTFQFRNRHLPRDSYADCFPQQARPGMGSSRATAISTHVFSACVQSKPSIPAICPACHRAASSCRNGRVTVVVELVNGTPWWPTRSCSCSTAVTLATARHMVLQSSLVDLNVVSGAAGAKHGAITELGVGLSHGELQ